MNDLISRQAAIDAICKACANSDDYVECVERRPESTFCDEIVALRKLPSAEPKQKTGKWITKSNTTPWYTEWWYACSECGQSPLRDRYGQEALSGYCPNCGCRMEVEEE